MAACPALQVGKFAEPTHRVLKQLLAREIRRLVAVSVKRKFCATARALPSSTALKGGKTTNKSAWPALKIASLPAASRALSNWPT